MNSGENNRGLYATKFGMFAISLFPMWLVLFIKDIDIPVYFGHDWQFVGWNRLLTYGNSIATGSAVMMIVAISAFGRLRHRTKGSPKGLPTTIAKADDRSVDYVNTLATIITLLGVVLVPIQTFREFLLFVVLMALIVVCYVKTSLYYSNPILAFLGFRLYTVRTNCIKDDFIGLFRGELKVGNTVIYYHVSDNVYYLES